MIHAHIPFLPPSINHAYFTRGRMRVLTKEGKSFKTNVQTHLARNHQDFLSFFDRNVPYCVIIRVSFPEEALFFKGWPEKASNRYKALDATNRIKLVEDAICAACKHDDRQHWHVAILKTTADGEGGTDIWAFNLEEEDSPLEYFGICR